MTEIMIGAGLFLPLFVFACFKWVKIVRRAEQEIRNEEQPKTKEDDIK